MFCPECGTKNDDTATFCGNCGVALNPQQSTMSQPQQNYTATPQYQQPAPTRPAAPPYQQPGYQQPQYQQPGYGPTQPYMGHIPRKDPVVAMVISFFLPGIGYWYNGSAGKGIGFFFVTIFTYFFLIGFLIHLYTIVDSYQDAKRVNVINGYPE